MEKQNLIYNDDCFLKLPELIKLGTKVDAIIIDPPYAMTNNRWDKPIDWEKWWELIKEIRRTPQTPIIIFGDFPFSLDLINSNRKWYRYTWYWNKLIGTGFLDSSYKPLKVIEHIHVFIEKPYQQVESQEDWKKWDRVAQFYPQFSEGNPNHSTGNKLAGSIGTTYKSFKTQNEIKSITKMDSSFYRTDLLRIGKKETDKHPKNYLEFKKVKPNKYIKQHPNEKPLDLLKYIIKTYTKEYDIVLDCFAGSGSTLVAANQLDRYFIGIEKEIEYFETIKKKLDLE